MNMTTDKTYKIQANETLFRKGIDIGNYTKTLLSGIVQNDISITKGAIKEWNNQVKELINDIILHTENVTNAILEQNWPKGKTKENNRDFDYFCKILSGNDIPF